MLRVPRPASDSHGGPQPQPQFSRLKWGWDVSKSAPIGLFASVSLSAKRKPFSVIRVEALKNSQFSIRTKNILQPLYSISFSGLSDSGYNL